MENRELTASEIDQVSGGDITDLANLSLAIAGVSAVTGNEAGAVFFGVVGGGLYAWHAMMTY